MEQALARRIAEIRTNFHRPDWAGLYRREPWLAGFPTGLILDLYDAALAYGLPSFFLNPPVCVLPLGETEKKIYAGLNPAFSEL